MSLPENPPGEAIGIAAWAPGVQNIATAADTPSSEIRENIVSPLMQFFRLL
jgi:hypothetical protein